MCLLEPLLHPHFISDTVSKGCRAVCTPQETIAVVAEQQIFQSIRIAGQTLILMLSSVGCCADWRLHRYVLETKL